MKCKIIDAISNKVIGNGVVRQFAGKIMTLHIDNEKDFDFTIPVVGELEDGSYRGEIKYLREIKGMHQFRIREAGIFDKRRYLRIGVRQKGILFHNDNSKDCIITEMAYASCMLLVDNVTMLMGDNVTVRIQTPGGEAILNGVVFDNCGEVGSDGSKSEMYIINFNEESLNGLAGDIIYSFILGLTRGR